MRATLTFATVLLAAPVFAQTQGPDLEYRPVLVSPAYAEDGPVILLDAAHGSQQTIEGRYAGLAALVRADGYEIRAGEQALDMPGALDGVDILVISNVTAQRVAFPDSRDREDIVFGLQTAGHDDQQFALNILHWLSRLI